MADKKNKKSEEDDSPFNSSGELFETLFREELDSLNDGQQQKAAPKKDKKLSSAKRPKPPQKIKGARPKKAVPQRVARGKKNVEEKPATRLHKDRSERVSTEPPVKTPKLADERPVSADKRDSLEEVRPKKMAKMKKTESSELGSPSKLGGGSDKIKVAVLCVILVAAMAFIVNALGIVEFGGLLGLSEPPKKENAKTRVAKKPPAKSNKKTARAAIRPPQKGTSNQVANKPSSQKKTLIVKKGPQPARSQAKPQATNRNTPSSSIAKKPVVVHQQYRPATPPERPPAIQDPPRPPSPQQRPVVVMKPSEPAPTTQKDVNAKRYPKPSSSTPRPVVSKKPQPIATPKPPLLKKEPPKPAMPTQGKKISANGELFPEERIRSYPYSVYLGSYKTRERAEKAIFEFQRKGLSPYWVEVYLGEKGVWYRVFNGYYENREEAEAFIKKKRLEDAKAKRTKYATLIGIFATERDAQQNFVSLSRLGYHPYVIDQANGESMLFVGAFLTKKGAERLHKELASKGVRSRVVER